MSLISLTDDMMETMSKPMAGWPGTDMFETVAKDMMSFVPKDFAPAENLAAHPMAATAAASALAFGFAGQISGMMLGMMSGMTEAAARAAKTGSANIDFDPFGVMQFEWFQTGGEAAPLCAPMAKPAKKSAAPRKAKEIDAVPVAEVAAVAAPEIAAVEPEAVVMEAPMPAEQAVAAAPVASIEPEDFIKPAGVAKPSVPDDLKMIAGVGPKLEQVLNGLGIWTFAQVAAWTPQEVAWVDDYLQFKGRIERDDWIAQAAALAKGGRDEYVKVFGKEPR